MQPYILLFKVFDCQAKNYGHQRKNAKKYDFIHLSQKTIGPIKGLYSSMLNTYFKNI